MSRRSQSRLSGTQLIFDVSDWACWHTTTLTKGKHSRVARAETCCGSEPCERRDTRDRRENASQGRIPARSRTWPVTRPAARRRVFPRRRAVRRAACFRPDDIDTERRAVSGTGNVTRRDMRCVPRCCKERARPSPGFRAARDARRSASTTLRLLHPTRTSPASRARCVRRRRSPA